MIPIPRNTSIWLALGVTDMRRGMHGLALQVQEGLKQNPHQGDLYIFRGRTASLIKILWCDDFGMSLYTRRLEQGHFSWPSATDGAVAISASAMACLLEGIDWRKPQKAWRPSMVG